MKSKFLFHFTASGLYTSICLASLSLCTDSILLNTKPNWLYFCFIFSASFFYYNFHKIAWYKHSRIFDKSNLKYQWPSIYPGLLFLSLLSSFTCCSALFSFAIDNYYSFFLGVLASFIALMYNQKFLGIQLRTKKGLKAFVIGLVSIITTILIPTTNFSSLYSIDFLKILLFSLAQLLFVSALCVAADIRDTTEDHEDGIKTFPVILGISSSKKLVIVMLLINVFLLFIMTESAFLSFKQFEMLCIISLLSILFTSSLNQKNSYYFYILLIDGLILSQAIGVFLLKI